MKIVRPIAVSLLCATLHVGCAELITYSNKANEQGQKLYDQGRYEEAAGAFRNATQQNPASYRAFFMLGESYQQLGREQQALQSYRAALDVMPEPPRDAEQVAFRDRAVNGLATCIARSASRDAELTAVTDEAVRSSDVLDWYVVARTHAAVGDADNAIDAYDRTLRIGGETDPAIVKSFGLYLVQMNQAKRAEDVLTRAYRLRPDDAEVVAALRQLGVVPGPSLLAEDQLNRPVVPKGPIPELEVNVKDKNKPAPVAP